MSWLRDLLGRLGRRRPDRPEPPAPEAAASSRWTDHAPYLRRLFALRPIASCLEFGLGEGTRILLDHCGHVTSLELAARPVHEEWFQRCLESYRGYGNWDPVLHRCGEKLREADRIGEAGGYPIADRAYVAELEEVVERVLGRRRYDLAFVDAGIHNRGDLVNLLFGRVPIIAAHDTNGLERHYGWDLVAPPPEYRRVRFTQGLGTTFWIHESESALLARLDGD